VNTATQPTSLRCRLSSNAISPRSVNLIALLVRSIRICFRARRSLRRWQPRAEDSPVETAPSGPYILRRSPAAIGSGVPAGGVAAVSRVRGHLQIGHQQVGLDSVTQVDGPGRVRGRVNALRAGVAEQRFQEQDVRLMSSRSRSSTARARPPDHLKSRGRCSSWHSRRGDSVGELVGARIRDELRPSSAARLQLYPRAM
jgi:hypothetical protein